MQRCSCKKYRNRAGMKHKKTTTLHTTENTDQKFSININNMQRCSCEKYRNKAGMKHKKTTTLHKTVERKDKNTTLHLTRLYVTDAE